MRLKKGDETTVKLGCLGKVKTGEKHPQKGYPMSLDYFRFDSPIVSREVKLKEMFGDNPKSLNITFYSNDTNEVCSQRLELRDKGGRLIAYGDGELFKVSTSGGWEEVRVDSDGNKARIKGLQTTYSQGEYKAVWKETLILRFLIIGFPEIGYWELRTYGKETAIPQITSVFDFCLEKFGRVQMIPFTLTVGKHKSNRAEVNRNYSVIQLFCNVGVDAIEAVRNWDGVGLLSGDKLTASQKAIASPIEPLVIAERVFTEEVEGELIEDTEGVDNRESEFLRGIEDNLSMCHDADEAMKYYKDLCREYGEDVVRSINGFLELFIDKGCEFEIDD